MPLISRLLVRSNPPGWWIKWVPLVAVVCFAGVVVAFWFFAGGPVSDQAADWAEFGGYVGGVAGWLFGFFSLLVLVDTWRLQSTELRETRKELERSAEAARRQTFESAFFHLLAEKRETIAAMRVGERQGRDVPSFLKNEMRRKLQSYDEEASYKGSLAVAFSEVLADRGDLLDDYFRQVYHLFRFVERSGLDEANKIEYAHMARAQLSRAEVALLFYNGLSPAGEKFHRLIEKYALLKHVQSSDLLNDGDRRNPDLYSRAAYEDADDQGAR
jgi:hypothetical protein